MNSTVLRLVTVNLVAACAVFVLAYMAGASSGGTMLWQLSQLRSGALYLLLGAAGALVAGFLFVFFRLSNAVCAPVKALTEFAEQVSAGNFEARLDEVGGGTFGYINLHLNEAAARAAKAEKNQNAQRGVQRVENFAAALHRIREAANSVSANAKEILTASEMMATVPAGQERDRTKAPAAVAESSASSSAQADKARPAAASLAATVAAAMHPAVVAPPVSIPGAQITGAVKIPLPAASGAVNAQPELLRLQRQIAQREKDLTAERERKG